MQPMEPKNRPLQIGAWRIDPISGRIEREGQSAQIDTRSLRLLLCLAEHPGEVVSIDQLLDHAWPGIAVSPDSVYQAITSLRRTLGDDPKQPTYIATVPRLGYRLLATVTALADSGVESPQTTQDRAETASIETTPPSYVSPRKTGTRWIAVSLLAAFIALVAILAVRGNVASRKPVASGTPQAQQSIAVLPFLDLTDSMTEEPFADGMTEELIDKLSKVPGLRVPAPTSSFFFKGKQLPVADIAKSLGVVYILDGSVRKSGARLRVAARLVRADNGFVIWTETYDRPFTDKLWVQDDIATAVTKALKTSIGPAP
jgi:transcriptional activator of cad operon